MIVSLFVTRMILKKSSIDSLFGLLQCTFLNFSERFFLCDVKFNLFRLNYAYKKKFVKIQNVAK